MTPRRQRSVDDLLDERDALLRSIDDLERELAAGDLDAAAYEDLRATYVGRTAEVLRALAERDTIEDSAPEAPTRRSLRRRIRHFLGRPGARRVLGVGAAVSVVGTITLVALLFAGVRLPGQEETGGVVVPQQSAIAQSLARASALANAREIDQAIEIYDSVLQTVPNQPEALTYKGWLERLAGRASGAPGLVELGDAALARAATVAPEYADAQGLYGIALLEDGGAKSLPIALQHFLVFVRTKNNGAVLSAQGETMANAFVSAHRSVPPQLRPYLRTSTPRS
jgi:tetratricopeptide (TPR) repeat protein